MVKREQQTETTYGDFGPVAEGVTSRNIPSQQKIPTEHKKSQVDAVYNDENEIFAFAYDHAGQKLFVKQHNNNRNRGQGALDQINYENTRDGAVNKVRILGPVDPTPRWCPLYK